MTENYFQNHPCNENTPVHLLIFRLTGQQADSASNKSKKKKQPRLFNEIKVVNIWQ